MPERPGIIIAPHHAKDPWRPNLAWPAGTTVQWGGDGAVFGGPEQVRRTAFFEAFPKDGSAGFIRGEGATVDDAEAQAHAQWSHNAACMSAGGHRWTRTRRLGGGKTNTYTNGGCFCLRCNAFQTVMAPIVELGAYREPMNVTELDYIASGFCRMAPWGREDESSRKHRRRRELRAKWAGIDLPPVTPRDPDRDPFEPDEYERGCRRAVVAYCRANQDVLRNRSGGGGMGAVFDSLSAITLTRLMQEEEA